MSKSQTWKELGESASKEEGTAGVSKGPVAGKRLVSLETDGSLEQHYRVMSGVGGVDNGEVVKGSFDFSGYL